MADDAPELWDAILARGVTPCGLGARDTLRLEVCYPLHGNDITPETRRDLGRARLGVRARQGLHRRRARCARSRSAGPERKLVAFRMTESAIPRQGMAIAGGGEVTSGTHSPMLDVGIGMGYVPGRDGGAGNRARRSTCAASRARRGREEADLQERGVRVAASESYPDDLLYNREHDWARIEGDEAVLGDHLVRARRARRARPLRAARGRRDDREGQAVRRGRVGQGRLGRDRAALRRGDRGQRQGRRRARDGERGRLRRGLARSASG